MYAILLYLDNSSTALIKALWQKLADAGISSSMHDNGSQPHVTLGVFDDLDIEAAISRLDEFSTKAELPEIRFEVLGSFPASGVLHCTPTVTSSLLALHQEFHRRISATVSQPDAHYLPESWVPHCTLAVDLTLERLPQAFGAALLDWEPFQSRFQAIALVNVGPKPEELWVKRV